MTTKCIELEFPDDGRRKATIVTNNEEICKHLKDNPDAKLGIHIINEDGSITFGFPYIPQQ